MAESQKTRSASVGSNARGENSVPQVVSSTSSLDSIYAQAFPNGTDILEYESDLLQLGTDISKGTHAQAATGESVDKKGASQTEGLKLPTPSVPVLQTPSGSVVVPGANATGGSVPEFLYQLTKMLTDNNRDIIEWSNDRIEVHNPHKLETHVLHRYFRHSKFASFQRQLNYFGFRKLAGKGKMAPCSYVNDTAAGDIGCLLLVKRKVPTTQSKDKDKRSRPLKRDATSKITRLGGPITKVLVPPSVDSLQNRKGIDDTLKVSRNPPPKSGSHKALARSAIGKGIRHGYTAADCRKVRPREAQPHEPVDQATTQSLAVFNDQLSQLASNYQSSLNERQESVEPSGFLSRSSSLLDLAMIPDVDEGQAPANEHSPFTFVDFPNPEVKPLSTNSSTANAKESSS